jgi:hypothetical protein
MKYLFLPGSLKKKAEYNRLSNKGECAPEQPKYLEVRIITLKAFLTERAVELAFDRGSSLTDLEGNVKSIIRRELINVKEFVEVHYDHIRVCINCDVIDDSVILKAFDIVANIDLSHGTRIEFEQSVQHDTIQYAEYCNANSKGDSELRI